MRKWFVKVDIAGAEIQEPQNILEEEIWDTFEQDQRPFSVIWFSGKKEARAWYDKAREDFERTRELFEIRKEIQEAWVAGEYARMEDLRKREAELEF